MNLLHQGATPSKFFKNKKISFRPDEINFQEREGAVLHPLVTPRGLVNIKEKKKRGSGNSGVPLLHCTCTAGSHSARRGTRGRRRGE